MELGQEGHSLTGNGHAERALIEKKIFNPSLKHRQRQRWKVLPGQKMVEGKGGEEKAIHGLLWPGRNSGQREVG